MNWSVIFSISQVLSPRGPCSSSSLPVSAQTSSEKLGCFPLGGAAGPCHPCCGRRAGLAQCFSTNVCFSSRLPEADPVDSGGGRHRGGPRNSHHRVRVLHLETIPGPIQAEEGRIQLHRYVAEPRAAWGRASRGGGSRGLRRDGQWKMSDSRILKGRGHCEAPGSTDTQYEGKRGLGAEGVRTGSNWGTRPDVSSLLAPRHCPHC